MRRLTLIMLSAAVVFHARSVQAQETAAPDSTAAWRIGPFIGFARHSPVNSTLGITPGRDHLFIGFEASTRILKLGPLEASYAVQLLPLVMISGRDAPADYTGGSADTGVVLLADRKVPGPDRAFAVGASPFGFQISTAAEHRVSVYAATAAGALIFTRPFPVPDARQFNFTLEYGAGLRMRAGRERWVRVGYKYHHLSNAYTAKANPGLDGNVFYFGYDWGVRLPR